MSQNTDTKASATSGELLPCPFCGSTNIDPAEWSGNDGKFGPGCGDCGALGETAELWNRRASQPSASAPVDIKRWPDRLPHNATGDSVNDAMQAEIEELRAALHRQANPAPAQAVIEACEAERVEEVSPEDVAYNTAIENCVSAIKLLAQQAEAATAPTAEPVANEDAFIIDAVTAAQVKCVHPKAATTLDIGRAVLNAYRRIASPAAHPASTDLKGPQNDE